MNPMSSEPLTLAVREKYVTQLVNRKEISKTYHRPRTYPKSVVYGTLYIDLAYLYIGAYIKERFLSRS